MTDDRQLPDRPRRPPLQFSVRLLLVLPVVVGLLFGLLRWFGAPPLVGVVVLVILVVSAAAAVGLLVAIAGADDDGDP